MMLIEFMMQLALHMHHIYNRCRKLVAYKHYPKQAFLDRPSFL